MRWQRLVRFAGGYPFAFAAVAVAIVALLPARTHLQPSTIMLAVVPVIIIVARFAGLRASAVAAVAGFLALDVLFVPPYHRLTVASPAEWIALVVFLAVALVSGQQTARIREREDAAVRRQAELGLVNDLALRLTSEHSPSSTAALIVDSIVGLLAAERAALYVRPGAVDPVCLAGAGPLLAASAERAMVGWVGHNGKAIALDVAALPVDDRPVSVGPSLALEDVTADGVYLPLHAGQSVEGVLYVRWPGGAEAGPAETRLLVAIANLAAAALGRQRLDELAARAKALGEADALKSTLVSSVSHELKTPLAAATARIGGLAEAGGSGEDVPARVREEAAAALADLARLDGAIGDLLDMSQLESDAWRPRFELCDVSDVLGTVLAKLPEGGRERVRFELPEDLPPVTVDFAQVARALANLVENALTYSGPSEPVIIGARTIGPDVVIWVEDRGPGVPDAEKQAVFEKFHRGSASAAVPGTGLGLTIAAAIVRAHGGRVWVEDAVPRGARFMVTLRAGERVMSGGEGE